MLQEKEINRGYLGTVRGISWSYISVEQKYEGSKEIKTVHRLYSSDFRKFIYVNEHFRQSGGGQQNLPKTIQKRFLEKIK